MEIPVSWSSHKRNSNSRDSSRKKQKVDSTIPSSLESVCSEICQNVLDVKHKKVDNIPNFDSILSSVPYRTILESLFGDSKIPHEDIPVLTKRFEESFMRECIMQGERKCVMGSERECRFIDKDNQFTAAEFLMPGQTTMNSTPQMCVLCSRKHTQKLFYDVMYRPPVCHIGIIQRYGVICNANGEYNTDYVLMIPPTGPVQAMPYPSPVHNRNNYTVVVRNAIRYIVQRPEMGIHLPSHDNP